MTSLAYMNHGRWVAECPNSANAWEIQRGDAEWPCTMCSMMHPIRWPTNPDDIEAALAVRPTDSNGVLQWSSWVWGETIADLENENQRRPWRTHPAYGGE